MSILHFRARTKLQGRIYQTTPWLSLSRVNFAYGCEIHRLKPCNHSYLLQNRVIIIVVPSLQWTRRRQWCSCCHLTIMCLARTKTRFSSSKLEKTHYKIARLQAHHNLVITHRIKLTLSVSNMSNYEHRKTLDTYWSSGVLVILVL